MALFLRVLPLALGAAVSPTVLAVTLLILARRERALRSAVAYTIGLAVPLAVLTVLVLTVWSNAAPTTDDKRRTVAAIVDVTAAVLLLGFGVRGLLRRRAGVQPKRREARQGAGGPFESLALGVVMMLTNFSTIVLYIPAMREVAAADESTVVQGAVVGIAALFALAPALLPLGATAIAPDASRRVLDPIGRFVRTHSATIGTVVSFVFGLYLLVKGARGL